MFLVELANRSLSRHLFIFSKLYLLIELPCNYFLF